jgi:hypothetical protein
MDLPLRLRLGRRLALLRGLRLRLLPRRRRRRLNLALLRLLLTRRARNASGTATQCTRRNDLSHHRRLRLPLLLLLPPLLQLGHARARLHGLCRRLLI